MSENVTKNDVAKDEKDDKIEEQAEVSADTSAGDSTPEDTLAAYEALFEKQKKQIEEAAAANKNLQNQINILMRRSANVSTDETNEQSVNVEPKETDSDDYVSLADLGKELGKRDYKNHNLEE